MESECGIQMGDKGGDWETISIPQRWLYLQDAFFQHVLVSPYEIWDILMGRNRDEPNPKRQLRIGMAGNVGGGSAAINAMVETIEGLVGGRAMVAAIAALSEREGSD